MKVNFKYKMLTDALMTAVLLLLMAYQVTGEKYHEWLGVFMFLLFLIHNALNIRWYGKLFQGRYGFLRVMRTLVNLAVFIAMLCLAYSGVVMSRHVFAALPIQRGMALARRMHLAGSYWGFVLMGIHLGLHWGIVAGMFHKLYTRHPVMAMRPSHKVCGERKRTVISWIMRLSAVLIAGYGAFCFRQADIASYLFLKVEFAFIDYEKNAALVLLQNMAMMGLWVFIAYYITKGAEKISKAKQEEKSNEGKQVFSKRQGISGSESFSDGDDYDFFNRGLWERSAGNREYGNGNQGQ